MKKQLITITSLVLFLVFSADGMAAGKKQKTSSPLTVAGATTITGTQAKQLHDKGIIFIDVRKDSDWKAGRIPGAKHIELKMKFSQVTLSSVAKPDQEVVIYCNGPTCPRSSQASSKAVNWGYKNVYYYRDGVPDWKKLGFNTEK